VKDVILVYIIVAAVRGNKSVAKATPSEVENTMKLWLQYAADCDGGRQARRRRALWLQTTMEQTLMFLIKADIVCISRLTNTVSSVQA